MPCFLPAQGAVPDAPQHLGSHLHPHKVALVILIIIDVALVYTYT